MRNYIIALIIASVLGIGATAYLSYSSLTGMSVVCPVGESGACNAITQSSYSKMFGIPVSYLGLVTWVLILFLASRLLKEDKVSLKYSLWVITALGVAAAGYYNGVMLLKLGAVCLWCETSHFLMLGSFGVASALTVKHKTAVITGLLVLLTSFGVAAYSKEAVDLNPFADCLSSKNVTMYGAYWCPHCKNQKVLFGKSFSKVKYFECAQGNGQKPECTALKVEGYPTWIFGDGKRISGELTLEQLSARTGCELPV